MHYILISSQIWRDWLCPLSLSFCLVEYTSISGMQVFQGSIKSHHKHMRQKSTPCLWYPQIFYFNSSETFGSISMRIQSTGSYKFIWAGDHNALHCWSSFMLYSQRAQHCPHPYLKEKKQNAKKDQEKTKYI